MVSVSGSLVVEKVMLSSTHLFLSALETSRPCSTRLFLERTKIALKFGWASTSLSYWVASSRPCSLMTICWLPSSNSGLSLSRIEGLQMLAFSKTAHSPSLMALMSTESTHSNLEAPRLQMEIRGFSCSNTGAWCFKNFSMSLICACKSRGPYESSDSRFMILAVSSGLLLKACRRCRMADKSWDVCSKQPRSCVVSLLSESKIRLSSAFLIPAMRFKHFINLVVSSVVRRIGKLTARQSLKLCSCIAWGPFISSKSARSILLTVRLFAASF